MPRWRVSGVQSSWTDLLCACTRERKGERKPDQSEKKRNFSCLPLLHIILSSFVVLLVCFIFFASFFTPPSSSFDKPLLLHWLCKSPPKKKLCSLRGRKKSERGEGGGDDGGRPKREERMERSYIVWGYSRNLPRWGPALAPPLFTTATACIFI